jgi:hypothetical protein
MFGDRSSIANYFVATFAPGGSTDTLLASAFIAKHFFELPRVPVRLDHVASIIINANHGMM